MAAVGVYLQHGRRGESAGDQRDQHHLVYLLTLGLMPSFKAAPDLWQTARYRKERTEQLKATRGQVGVDVHFNRQISTRRRWSTAARTALFSIFSSKVLRRLHPSQQH
jgi:hypothetical protein